MLPAMNPTLGNFKMYPTRGYRLTSPVGRLRSEDMATETSAATAPNPTPAAAQAASSSTSPQEFSTKVKQASTPADVRALVDQLRSDPQLQLKPQPTTPPAASQSAASPAAEDTPAGEAPATEATPETTTPAAEDTPAEPVVEGERSTDGAPTADDAGAAQPEDQDDMGEGPVTPIQGKRTHLRINDQDEVGKLALAFQKRNRDWTLEQSLEAARKQLGINTKPNDDTKQDDKKAKLPKTVEDVDRRFNELAAAHKNALVNVNFEEASAIQVEMMQLQQHRFDLERSAERIQQQEAARYDAEFAKSEAKAVELYPFAADPKSAAAKRMKAIDDDLKANDDPLYYSPNKPLKIAQMVAAEMNIAPKSKTPPPAKPAAVTPTPKKGVLPSGGSSTTPPPANQPPAIVNEIRGAKSIGDIRAIHRKLGIPT